MYNHLPGRAASRTIGSQVDFINEFRRKNTYDITEMIGKLCYQHGRTDMTYQCDNCSANLRDASEMWSREYGTIHCSVCQMATTCDFCKTCFNRLRELATARAEERAREERGRWHEPVATPQYAPYASYASYAPVPVQPYRYAPVPPPYASVPPPYASVSPHRYAPVQLPASDRDSAIAARCRQFVSSINRFSAQHAPDIQQYINWVRETRGEHIITIGCDGCRKDLRHDHVIFVRPEQIGTARCDLCLDCYHLVNQLALRDSFR